jgi:hypothetical protein
MRESVASDFGVVWGHDSNAIELSRCRGDIESIAVEDGGLTVIQ